MPTASTSPNSDKAVQREPECRHHGEGADDRDRDRQQRDDGRPEVLQEDNHDEHHQHDRLDDRFLYGGKRVVDESGGVVADVARDPIGVAFLELVEGAVQCVRGGQRVRTGPLKDQHGNGGLAHEVAVGDIIERAEFHAGHVADAHQSAVGAGPNDDPSELLGVIESALRVQHDLRLVPVRHRRLR